MNQPTKMDLPQNIKDEIWEYCRLNNITNIDDFILKMVKQGFTVEKYGAVPAATSITPVSQATGSTTTKITTETKADLYGEDN